MPTFLLSLARAVGLAAACAAIVLYGSVFAEEPTWPIAVMILLALLAAWASLTIRPLVLCGVFFASFFPIGLYLTFTSGFLKWIGVCDVLYLVAARLMLVVRGYRGSHSGAQGSDF
jgi:hypothetical protein